MFFRIVLIVLILLINNVLFAQNLYKGNGSISFISDAPMEKIQAKTTELQGIIDVQKKTFAFVVDVRTFEGFNSPLQKEHFNEHYLETQKYKQSTYTGVIITNQDLTQNYTQAEVICKGKFTIHGITKFETVKLKWIKNDKKIIIKAFFNIRISDYNIKLPKLVQNKIAPEIIVEVQSELLQSNG